MDADSCWEVSPLAISMLSQRFGERLLILFSESGIISGSQPGTVGHGLVHCLMLDVAFWSHLSAQTIGSQFSMGRLRWYKGH